MSVSEETTKVIKEWIATNVKGKRWCYPIILEDDADPGIECWLWTPDSHKFGRSGYCGCGSRIEPS